MLTVHIMLIVDVMLTVHIVLIVNTFPKVHTSIMLMASIMLLINC
jgi:hypothetical protein